MTASTTNQEEPANLMAEWEKRFAQRYTDEDDQFIHKDEKNYEPPVLDDWKDLPKRSFDPQRRNGRDRFQNHQNRQRERSRSPHRTQHDRCHSNDGNNRHERSRSSRRYEYDQRYSNDQRYEHDRAYSNGQRYDSNRHRNFQQRDHSYHNNRHHDHCDRR